MIIIFESNHDDDCEDHAEVWNYGMAAAMDGRASRWEVGYRITSIIFDGDDDGDCIDEMPKSQIEKRKRNMQSTSQVSRREKRNVEICFLVREEKENFCKKDGEILNIFSSFEMRREIQKYFL